MYKIEVKNDFTEDINKILKLINEAGYKIRAGNIITKSANATKNMFEAVWSSVVDEFDNAPKKVKAELIRLWDAKEIKDDGGPKTGNECTIPEPTPCDLAEDLIAQFNDRKNIQIDPCTYEYSRKTLGGGIVQLTYEEHLSLLKAYLQDYNRSCSLYYEIVDGKKVYPHKGKGFPATTNIEPRMAVMAQEFERAARRTIRMKLAYNGSELTDAIELVKEYMVAMKVPESVAKFEVLELQNDYQTICSYVLLHWMWLVKRNLSDDPTTVEEIFLNIFGAQSSGKTTFIEHISNALQYFYAESDISRITDPRELKLFANKRIVFFDEFGSKAKMTQDEVAAMKKIITGGEIHQRVMNTTNHTKLQRRFTGISATNMTIGDIIKDETGARRYFEIITDTSYSQSEVIHFDFDFLDNKKVAEENGKESYIDIWQVVDDTINEGYISMNESIREDIRKIQSTYVPLSSSVQFLNSAECTYVNAHFIPTVQDLVAKEGVGPDGYQALKITDLYKKYLAWCKGNNLEQSKTQQNFKRDVDDLNILITTRKAGFNNDGSQKRQNIYYVYNEVLEDDDEE